MSEAEKLENINPKTIEAVNSNPEVLELFLGPNRQLVSKAGPDCQISCHSEEGLTINLYLCEVKIINDYTKESDGKEDCCKIKIIVKPLNDQAEMAIYKNY